jgi:chorismate mutase
VAESMVALTLFDHLTRQRLLARKSVLRDLRDTIDLIDQNILLLLSERQGLVRQIGLLKKKRGTRVFDKSREKEILRKQLKVAKDLGLDTDVIGEMIRAIFKLAKTSQRAIGGK